MEFIKIDETKRNKLNRRITGVIQEDRIWEQWYDQDIFEKPLPKMSQKDYLYKCIADEPNRVIINNRGMKKITVSEFQKMILKYEKAFAMFKLKKGDIICTIGLTTPEMYAIKYAATSLGLITCNLNVFDVGKNDGEKNRLYRQLENVDPKMIFTLDILEKNVYEVINSDKFSNAVKVTMPLDYSTPILTPERYAIGLMTLKNFLCGKKIKNSLSLNQFLKIGSLMDENLIEEVYEEGMPCNISFTSGTTGINKAVLLSHDANNAIAFQHEIGKFGFKKGQKNLALVPPFLAFWDADIVHNVLCLGGEEIIELYLQYEKIPDYVKKYKPNIGAWSQYLWSSLEKLPEKDRLEVSQYLEHAIVGGERCEKGPAKEFYESVGVYQDTGYGATEVNTAFTMTHPSCVKIGTAGIPFPFNNVMIVDDSFKNVTYNQCGRLFITGPCLMNGYYNRPDLTDKVIFTDKNGVKWYNTGDYAIMDEDGCLTVIDRYTPPVVINSNGAKKEVNILDIVETIKDNEYIKHAKMTYHNEKLVLHVSTINSIDQNMAINSIIETIKSKLEYIKWPDYINVYKDLPRTEVGKVDYPNLSEIGTCICEEHPNEEKLFVIKNEVKIKKLK